MKWLPIETVPKDGTLVLCACMNPLQDKENGFEYIAIDYWDESLQSFIKFRKDYWPATHWMPLPEPPQR